MWIIIITISHSLTQICSGIHLIDLPRPLTVEHKEYSEETAPKIIKKPNYRRQLSEESYISEQTNKLRQSSVEHNLLTTEQPNNRQQSSKESELDSKNNPNDRKHLVKESESESNRNSNDRRQSEEELESENTNNSYEHRNSAQESESEKNMNPNDHERSVEKLELENTKNPNDRRPFTKEPEPKSTKYPNKPRHVSKETESEISEQFNHQSLPLEKSKRSEHLSSKENEHKGTMQPNNHRESLKDSDSIHAQQLNYRQASDESKPGNTEHLNNRRRYPPIRNNQKTQQVVFRQHERASSNEKDSDIKSKIATLVMQTVHDTEIKVKSIAGLKAKHREQAPYKIGFILSMIKKARDVMNELFNVAVKHRDEWKALEQLKIFELIVHTNVDTTNLVRQLVEIHIQHMNTTGTPDRKRVVLLR